MQVAGVEVTVFRKRTSTMATTECRKGEELLGAYIRALRALREHQMALTGPVRLIRLAVAVRKIRDARLAFWNHSRKHGCYGKDKN